MQKEGSVLRELNDAEVANVPTLECHGDVYDSLGQMLVLQQTVSHRHQVVEDGQLGSIKMHTHYRLAVREVGLPLSEFEDGYEFVFIILTCIIGECTCF